jgi:hypothetical protein
VNDALKLLPHEVESATWQKVSAYYQHRLDLLRRKNDTPLSEFETATLRGRIAEAKHLLALAEPAPVVVADD